MKRDVNPEIFKSEDEWLVQLGPERFHVLREAGTERAFTGSLLERRGAGIYRCGACSAPLFTADEKFESHCGWPSFTRPSEREHLRLLEDRSHGMQRIEVRCRRCDSHLGHLFDDGPEPEGTRYCINSLSLTFEPEKPPDSFT